MLEELSNIIKETDFIWEGNKPEIGTLRHRCQKFNERSYL